MKDIFDYPSNLLLICQVETIFEHQIQEIYRRMSGDERVIRGTNLWNPIHHKEVCSQKLVIVVPLYEEPRMYLGQQLYLNTIIIGLICRGFEGVP